MQRRGIIVTEPVPRKKSKKYMLDIEEIKSDLDCLKTLVEQTTTITKTDHLPAMIMIGDILDISSKIQERVSQVIMQAYRKAGLKASF